MEICVDITERRERRDNFLYLRPKGGIVLGVTKERIRSKWVEIFGELLRPNKRHMYEGVPGFATIVSAWKPQWYNAWRDMANRVINADEAWNQIVRDGIIEDMPSDPRGDVPVTDTWLWSSHDGDRYLCERKRFLILNLDHEDAELPRKARHMDNGNIILGPAHKIDYEIDLGISQVSLIEINDSNKLFHPRLNYTVSFSVLKPLFDAKLEIKPEDVDYGDDDQWLSTLKP